MTLRPASAMWSSGVHAGRLADDEMRVRRGASSTASLTTSDVDGVARCSGWHGACPRSSVSLGWGASPSPGAVRCHAGPATGTASPAVADRRPSCGRDFEAPGLQLAAAGRGESLVGREDLGQDRQALLGALDQLGFELDEAVDDSRARHDIDLVEAQFDPRIAVADDALAAQLADGDELDERRVAGQLEDERPRIRRRPFERTGASDRPDLRAPRGASTRRLPRSGPAT